MTTMTTSQTSVPSRALIESDRLDEVMKQSRRVGVIAALMVSAALLPILARLFSAVSLDVFSVAGGVVAVVFLTAVGFATSRWARCSVLREESERATREALIEFQTGVSQAQSAA